MPYGMRGMMGGWDAREAEYDQSFLAAMIMHHQGALLMAQDALSEAKHEELKQLARDIIEAQTKEIEQMQAWQNAWASE